MRPILFHLGPFPVFAFGFLVATGVSLSLILMARKARRTGFPPGDMSFDMVLVTVASGFLGARIYYVLQNLSGYLQNPLQLIAVWEGGLIFYGGQVGALLGILIYFKLKKIAPLKGLDFVLPYVALSHAFGRLGCFMNGCCYGKACDLPWAIQFPDLPYPVHPTQLYEAALNTVLFLFLIWRDEKKRFDGEVTLLYFASYAVIRFGIEFARADNPFWGLLTINQWISLAVFLAAGICYAFLNSRIHRRSPR